MTKDDVKRLARKAGAAVGAVMPDGPEIIFPNSMDVYLFANLVIELDRKRRTWVGVDFDINTKQPWVGLTETDFSAINQSCLTKLQAATSAESILKEKNS